MFIRKDFEEEIKNRFGVEKLAYRGIGQNLFNDRPSFVFDTGRGVVCIETGLHDIYYIYEVEEDFVSPDLTYKVKPKFNYFYVLKGTTFLRIDRVIVEFTGMAFDFTQELVLLALEKEN